MAVLFELRTAYEFILSASETSRQTLRLENAVLSCCFAKCTEIFIAENIKLRGGPFDLRGGGSGGFEKKIPAKPLQSKTESCNTNGYKKECMDSSKNIAYTTGQWEKNSCSN